MPNLAETLELASDLLRQSPAARFEAGRSRRESVPLEAHAEVSRDPARVDPLAILVRQDENRLPDLVPLRYGRMSRTPFTFLRGAAALMASDLAAGLRTDLGVELCGDAHVGNFRWFRAPDRQFVFDLNDFDETLPGPFEWDVKRLAASITVAGRSNGFSKEQCRAAARQAVRNYREFITDMSDLDPLELYYSRIDPQRVFELVQRQGKRHRKWKEDTLSKAERKNSLRALKKLTRVIDGKRVIVPDPPRIVRVDERVAAAGTDEALAFFKRYRETLPLDRRVLLDRFSLVDVARKVVGVGSVGTRCLITLLEAGDGTPLFLQFKQANASVLEPYLGVSAFMNAGQRVVEGQLLIQAASDIFLGWARWEDETGHEIDFYFRQLWDGKGKLEIEEMEPERMAIFGGLCGKALAFAHARSGDAMMIRGYIGKKQTFDDVLVEFADRYADRTERDHKQLETAIADGAIKVIREN